MPKQLSIEKEKAMNKQIVDLIKRAQYIYGPRLDLIASFLISNGVRINRKYNGEIK